MVAQTLWENFLVHYGWPEKILTDQGKSFENNLLRELCELAQVKKLCTSPYHPETNGQCEHFSGEFTYSCQKELAGVGYYPNTCLQLCCFFCDRGQSLFCDVWTNSKNTLGYRNGGTLTEQHGDTSYQNYDRKLKARLEWAYQVAHENNQKESVCNKKYYDK